MTTAERRAAILQQLAHAGAPLAARTLATHYGVSRQVIVQDLAVIRASHPGIISTARGYVLEQPDQPAGCTREFKVRHTPDRTGQELNLIVDCGGRVKNISISHRVYGRITAEMDIRSRQDVQELLAGIGRRRFHRAFHRNGRLPLPPCGSRHPRPPGFDRPGLAGCRFPGPPAAVGKRKVSKIEKRPFELFGFKRSLYFGLFSL